MRWIWKAKQSPLWTLHIRLQYPPVWFVLWRRRTVCEKIARKRSSTLCECVYISGRAKSWNMLEETTGRNMIPFGWDDLIATWQACPHCHGSGLIVKTWL